MKFVEVGNRPSRKKFFNITRYLMLRLASKVKTWEQLLPLVVVVVDIVAAEFSHNMKHLVVKLILKGPFPPECIFTPLKDNHGAIAKLHVEEVRSHPLPAA